MQRHAVSPSRIANSSKGYIKKAEIKGYCGFEITEDGELELAICKMERYHFWIPTILSLIAIIVSIFAIICG